MGQSKTEEDYLKAIYTLSRTQPKGVSTKSIGDLLKIKPPTVSDMLRKLGDKKVIKYARYKGVTLTKEGEKIALKIIRKHRLWETFLVEHFKFKWDEVHDIAEQLEHIDSPKLVNRLDEYLGFPRFDPHGDPIPDKEGVIAVHHDKTLDQISKGQKAVVVGVKDHSAGFLKHLESISITLGTEVEVLQVIDYDKSFVVMLDNKSQRSLSYQVCKNLLIN
ncbi:MAG: metal-dependent transcriptional regulator [Fidelibacterota bacterium]